MGGLRKKMWLNTLNPIRKKSTTKGETVPSSSSHFRAREEQRVPMTRLRAKIAERLLQAQHNAAMLTTFNEVNLKAVMELRTQYKDSI